MGWNGYILKPRIHTLKFSTDLSEIKDIETKDIWQILDDTGISSIHRFLRIEGNPLIVKQVGVRTREPTGGLKFTPYLFYETGEEIKNYKEFIKQLKKLDKSFKINKITK